MSASSRWSDIEDHPLDAGTAWDDGETRDGASLPLPTVTGKLGVGFPPKSILYRLIVRVDIEASNDDM
jgi:hypothetical protein